MPFAAWFHSRDLPALVDLAPALAQRFESITALIAAPDVAELLDDKEFKADKAEISKMN